MADIWGRWILHDGSGCPCRGMWVESITFDGEALEHIAGGECRECGIDANGEGSAWTWVGEPHPSNIRRYRIRKPRGLIILEEQLENLPEKVGA